MKFLLGYNVKTAREGARPSSRGGGPSPPSGPPPPPPPLHCGWAWHWSCHFFFFSRWDTDPSFMSMSVLVLDLQQFSFIKYLTRYLVIWNIVCCLRFLLYLETGIQIDNFTSFTVSDLFGNTILPYFSMFYMWKIVRIIVVDWFLLHLIVIIFK